MTAPAAATTPKSASVWEDFVDIFYAPSAVFARRRDGRFGIAMLVYVVLSTVVFTVARPMMQPIFDRMSAKAAQSAKEKNPNLTDEQLQSGMKLQEKLTTGPLGAVVIAVTQTITIFVVAFLAWIAGKLFGSVANYSQCAMITTYAFYPRLLGLLIGAALLYVVDPSSLTSMQAMTLSPARFLGEDASPVLAALLARFDVFVLWGTALIGIGLGVVGKLTRTWAIASAVVVWGVATLFALLGALRSA